MISDTCLECHKHQTCFLCGEVIDWIEDYGHVHPDRRGSCNSCYDNKNATLVWHEQYKELEDSND